MRARLRVHRAPACPAWCRTVHRGDRAEAAEGIRTHVGVDHGGAAGEGRASVELVRADNLLAGIRGPVGVYVAVDEQLTPIQALQLAAALLNAVDVVRPS